MPRLNQTHIAEIIRLTKSGKSLNFISKKLSIGKTSAYYHFRKIRKKTFFPPVMKFDSDETLGEVVGIFAGDGSQSFDQRGYHYLNRIHFGLQHKAFALYVKKMYEKCFGKRFYFVKDGETKIVLATSSKDIWNFFHIYLDFDSKDKSCTAFIRKQYISNREFLIGFLRGFLDTDGTYKDDGTRIAFYTSSQKLSKQISNALKFLGIENGITKAKKRDNYQIYVLKRSCPKLMDLLKPFWADRSIGRSLAWHTD